VEGSGVEWSAVAGGTCRPDIDSADREPPARA
jgi:hypothetical protein